MSKKIFEVIAAGYYSGTDATDARILHVSAESQEEIEQAIKGTGARMGDELFIGVLDHELPASLGALRVQLLAFQAALRPVRVKFVECVKETREVTVLVPSEIGSDDSFAFNEYVEQAYVAGLYTKHSEELAVTDRYVDSVVPNPASEAADAAKPGA